MQEKIWRYNCSRYQLIELTNRSYKEYLVKVERTEKVVRVFDMSGVTGGQL